MVGKDLKPGDRVRFVDYEDKPDFGKGKLAFGAIVEHVPSKGGYMVLPDGYDRPGGFGYSELTQVGPTQWERIEGTDVDFG